MNESEPTSTASPPPAPAPGYRALRAWPAPLLALLMLVARFGPGLLEDGSAKYWMAAVFGPLLCCVLLLIWWLAASRATWRERLFGFLGLVAAAFLTLSLAHPSMRGPATTYLTLPTGFFLFAIAATVLRASPPAVRSRAAVLLAAAGFGISALLRADGMTGDYQFEFHPRWRPTTEESMLAGTAPAPAKGAQATDLAPLARSLAQPEWAEFRGPGRAGRSPAPRIATNWTTHPPKQLWKVPIGPAWSSVAVAGRLLFTQEQRGPKEGVICQDAETGRVLWRTEVDARLEDQMGGPGPRATPTLSNGGLYVVGSTGTLMRLDPLTGRIVWKKELTEVAASKVPMWGFSSSPLVLGSVVAVYGGGAGEKGLLAFDTSSGDLRWSAPCPENSYGSPQLSSLLGEQSVLMLSCSGLLLLDPSNGKTRLDYDWKINQYRAIQPHVVGVDTVLLPTGMNMGTRAIRVKKGNGTYSAEELWTSRQLKPDFVDLVTHGGHAYGNDGGILTCIDLQSGDRKWKGGRYGKGQILLLENSGLLLILSEQGQVVLVPATPSGHQEIASFQALEGKTWNHPVLVGDRLYVRNSEQAAAYQLPLE